MKTPDTYNWKQGKIHFSLMIVKISQTQRIPWTFDSIVSGPQLKLNFMKRRAYLNKLAHCMVSRNDREKTVVTLLDFVRSQSQFQRCFCLFIRLSLFHTSLASHPWTSSISFPTHVYFLWPPDCNFNLSPDLSLSLTTPTFTCTHAYTYSLLFWFLWHRIPT